MLRCVYLPAALSVFGSLVVACGPGSTADLDDSGNSPPGAGAEMRPGSRSDSGFNAGSDSSSSDPGLETASGPDSGSSAGAPSDAGHDVSVLDAGSGRDGEGCQPKFASGLNAAWVQFASDVPTSTSTLSAFKTLFANTYAAGGRVVRWWFHTNGTVTPGYDSSGNAVAVSQSNINDIKRILDAASAAGVWLDISLWSFDMLQGNEGISAATMTNNKNLLMVDGNRQKYIDNVLTPLVTALKGYPGLYSWEIFNEPEGMTTQHGWTASSGGQNANVSGMTNYYSNGALQGAGGKPNGTLDFYEVHYYASNGSQYSCYAHQASYWSLEKPIVMGEFYALATDGVAAADTYTAIYGNGYAGAWAWQYESSDGNGQSTKWPAMQVPMQNLRSAHAADIDCP
jgi:hypothetical protein